MKIRLFPKRSSGSELVRNIVAGTVIWAGALALVVFFVLEPSDSVQQQLGISDAVTEVAAIVPENPIKADAEQTDDIFTNPPPSSVTSEPVEQTASDSSDESQSQTGETEVPASSIVYEGDSGESSPTAENEPEQTETASTQPAQSEPEEPASEVSAQVETEASQVAVAPTPEPVPEEVPSEAPTSSTGSASTGATPTLTNVTSTRRELFIQIGAFAKLENAEEKRKEYSRALYPVKVTKDDASRHLVLVGPYLTESEAKRVQSNLTTEFKLKDSFLKFVDTEIVREAAAATSQSGTGGNQSSGSEPGAGSATVVKGWYVRVGAFKNLGNARTSKLRVEKLNLATIITSDSQYNILMVGPFVEKGDAQIALNKISQELEIKDAYIVDINS